MKKDVRIQVDMQTIKECQRIYKKDTKTTGFVSNTNAITYVLSKTIDKDNN